MNTGKNKVQYWKDHLQVCEAKLPTLMCDPERYKIAFYHIEYLKSWIKSPTKAKGVDNSVSVHADVIEYINSNRE